MSWAQSKLKTLFIMFLMILLFLSGVVLSRIAFAAPSENIDKTQPYHMMKQVAEKAFARLSAEQTLIHNDPEHLKVIVEEEFMPYVNEQYAALKLLGPNLKGADKNDVNQFVRSFRDYLVTSYAQVLTQYNDQKIEFAPETTVASDARITSIKVDIIDSPRPNIKLEFKLRKNSKTGEWQAFDIIAEGISLLSSKQSEWSGKIRSDGILSVAKELESLAQNPISFEEKK